jgi:hypothetical protein
MPRPIVVSMDYSFLCRSTVNRAVPMKMSNTLSSTSGGRERVRESRSVIDMPLHTKVMSAPRFLCCARVARGGVVTWADHRDFAGAHF